MRHFVSLLMVLAMVVALAAPALAGASTETVTPVIGAAAVEALGQEIADTLTADVFVEANPEVYAETIDEMFKGEEAITVGQSPQARRGICGFRNRREGLTC